MKKLFITFFILHSSIFTIGGVHAQNEFVYDNAIQLWRNTDGSAALTVDSTNTRGYAEFTFNHTTGTYHRVQEGATSNQFSFYTERYQHIGKYLYGYGSFRFGMGRTQDRAWSDVMRTYNSNPFISGSSVPGKYDNQEFEMKGRLSTISLNGWRLGASIDYNVGDLSRLRDPRSRNRLLDYKLTPSVAYTSGNSTFGIAGYYERRKEKMPTLTTVQNNPNLYYYQMTGLDAVSGTLNGYSGFSREYVNHRFGGELEYGYKNENFATVNALNISRAEDNIYEQYMREPGRYNSYAYGLSTQNRIMRSNMIHQLDLKVQYEQGYADEFRPQLVITIDSVNGYNSYHYENLLTYKKRYQLEELSASLHYRLNFIKDLNNKKDIINYIGINTSMNSVSQKHLLPLSTFDLKTLTVGAEYGHALIGNRLWIMADVDYLTSLKADMSLANPETEYSKQVLLKDIDYYNANYIRGHLTAMYQFPVKIKKTRSQFYIKGYFEGLSAQNALHRTSAGISLGVTN